MSSAFVIAMPWSFRMEGTRRSLRRVPAVSEVRIVASEDAAVWCERKSNRPPFASFPFVIDGRICRQYQLPTYAQTASTTEFPLVWGIGAQTETLVQEKPIVRLGDAGVDGPDSRCVSKWIGGAVRSFQEAAEGTDAISESFGGVIRRTLKGVIDSFRGTGEADAQMSPIVQYAADVSLYRALESVATSPRRILERVRESMKISRIQQMDAACIRDYARRPGDTPAEKAGSRQELLGVNRIENINTLENRVAVWVMRRLTHDARLYVRENLAFSDSSRVHDVRRFGRKIREWHTLLAEVSESSLVHPVVPNYPLQLEQRYRKIYSTYRALLSEQRVLDDAWGWQRVLWGSEARILFYAAVRSVMTAARYELPLYVRRESVRGRWMPCAFAPGPFGDVKGAAWLLVDAWDIREGKDWLESGLALPGRDDLGWLGCEVVLYNVKKQTLVVVWIVSAVGMSDKARQNCLKECSLALSDFERKNCRVGPVYGIALALENRADRLETENLTWISAEAGAADMFAATEGRVADALREIIG